MKKTTFVSFLILALTMVAGCHHRRTGVNGSGNRKTEQREMSSFKAIDSEGAFEFEVTCQKPVSFSIEGDDNILPLIQSDVRDGVLYLRTEKGYNSRKGIVVRITVPNLESIKAAGAGKFHINDLKNEKFIVQTTGATALTASGETKNVEIHNSGAGKIDTGSLHAQKARVDISGAASVDVNASEQLDASVSGIGRVSYSGNPKTVNKSVSGMGIVSAKD
ncbi:MAG TPA: head GIN domain-containing protein [Pyrinomonadaceae bacterium]|nr:head GIN domain-containing protein [Pyrinomonadaceae bacterium]